MDGVNKIVHNLAIQKNLSGYNIWGGITYTPHLIKYEFDYKLTLFKNTWLGDILSIFFYAVLNNLNSNNIAVHTYFVFLPELLDVNRKLNK